MDNPFLAPQNPFLQQSAAGNPFLQQPLQAPPMIGANAQMQQAQQDIMANKAPAIAASPEQTAAEEQMPPSAQEAMALSRANPLGLVEQIPAGLQAGLGVAAKIAGYVAPFEGKTRAESAQITQAQMMEATKALAPHTETGQLLAGTIGAGIQKGQEALQDPEFYKKHGINPQGPVAAAGVMFSEIAPDLAAVYGIKGMVGKTGEYGKATPKTAAELDMTKLKPQEPPAPQGESVPVSFWKDRAEAITQKYRETPMQVTPEGQAVPHELSLAEEGNVSKSRAKITGKQFGGENPTMAPEDMGLMKDVISDPARAMEDEGPGPGKPIQGTIYEQGMHESYHPLSSTLAGAETLADRMPPLEVRPTDTPIQDLAPMIKESTISGGLKYQSMDLNKALTFARDNANSYFERKLAGVLLPIVDKAGITLQLVQDEKGNMKALTQTGARGNFQAWNKVVNLAAKGLNTRTLLHEMIHAATARYMYTGMKAIRGTYAGDWSVNKAMPHAPLVQSIVDSWKYLRDYAQRNGVDLTPEVLKNSATHYGLLDPLEMMSELANPRFRSWLNGILVPVKEGKIVSHISMWGKLQDAMRKMLGLNSIEHVNAFDYVFKHTMNAVEDYAKTPTEWGREFIQKAKQENIGDKDQKLIEAGNPELQKEKAIQDIPGLEGKSWLPDPGSFEANKPQILKEPDGGMSPEAQKSFFGNVGAHLYNTIGQYLSGGHITLSEIRNSTLLKTIGTLGTNGEKIYDMFRENQIAPLERHLTRFLYSPKNAEMLRQLFIKEMNDKQRYTPEQWRATGANKDVVDAYTHLRDVFDTVFDWTNKTRQARGLKPITREEAYMASRWNHAGYRADLFDAQGKKIWAISEHSHYAREQALKYIQNEFPHLQVENKRFVNVNERRNSLAAAYHEMVEALDPESPMVDAIKSLYQKLHDPTENVAGFEKHFQPKSGVRGFLGDRPWDPKNITDMFSSQLGYIKTAAKWNGMQDAFHEARTYLDDPEIRKAQPINVAYAEDYLKGKIGLGSNALVKRLENAFFNKMGVSSNTAIKTMSMGTSAFYITELAWKIPFMAVTLYQHAYAYPQHAYLVAKGFGNWNPARSFASGQKYGNLHTLLDSVDATTDLLGKPRIELPYKFDKHWEAAREYAHANNLLQQNPLTENADIEKGYIHNMVENMGNVTTAMTEKMSRSWTYYGFVDHLANSGKFDLTNHADLVRMYNLAERALKEVHGDYSPSERALIFNKFGIMGKQAAALKTYLIAMNQQLVHYSHEMVTNKNPAPLALFLAAQFAIGGTAGMFGMRTLDDVWNFIKKHLLTLHQFDLYNKVKDFSPLKYAQENLSDGWYQGPISKLTGTNLYVSGSMGNIVPWEMKEWFPALTENFEKLMDAAKFGYGSLHHGLGMPDWFGEISPNETAEAGYALAPAGPKGIVREGIGPYKAERFHAQGNKDLMLNPKNLNEALYERTPAEHIIGALGFVPNKEQRLLEGMRQSAESKETMAEGRHLLGNLIKEYMIHGDLQNRNKYLTMFFDFGGDQAELKHELGEGAFEQYLDEKKQALEYLQKDRSNLERTKQAIDFLHAIGEFKNVPALPTSNLGGR